MARIAGVDIPRNKKIGIVERIREIADLEDIEEVRRLPHLKLTRRCANGKNERR
jgi:hypothetical protein